MFLSRFKKKTALQNGSERAGPGQKNLARKQDGLRLSGTEVWVGKNGYVILMDGSGNGIDVLLAYPAHCHLSNI
jgi:hypothetical protein